MRWLALRIQALLPQPTRSGTVNSWDQSIPSPRTQIIRTVKADHNFSTNAKASIYWHYYTSHEYSGGDRLPAPDHRSSATNMFIRTRCG